MADQLDELARAAVRGWATAAQAWVQAANAIGVSWLNLPGVESGRTGFNEEVVVVPPQVASKPLHPEGFADCDGNVLSPDAMAVVPAEAGTGGGAAVCVRVKPPEGTASGTYTGSLSDSPGGRCLVDEIAVYVVGDHAP
jgi:hypothetical protein